ncbi:relaxase/mobilization nuclease domain-containing protein [Peptoniphilus equinus]|uniref:Relaxase/mobilization nuclease domain-containing protein n=1 Tax=Peptoniphilus equinus TaxID=3016343 RepID=A0ABY7QR95_9FIRM|nr:relaxase/mobilization nuclease domain-containing protein [Peptoniphilus equinus]WBW49308.1 relaxase/mobilization nuclease domain-containing protein [Peptoniphilus equinus]
MAYTEIHPIKFTVQQSIDYICRKDKVGEFGLISTYGCNEKRAGRQFIDERIFWKTKQVKGANYARHIIQSFNPTDHISVEEAHRVGREFCNEYLENKYQYVLTTHIDSGIIHNHIIFNNVSFVTGKCYDVTKDVPIIQALSDKICQAHGLTNIPEVQQQKKESNLAYTAKNSRSYFENMNFKMGQSWKATLIAAIDYCIQQADNYQKFLSFMEALKVEVRDKGKYLAFKFPGQEKFIRCREKTLGADYTRERIQERIEERVQKIESVTQEIPIKFFDKKFDEAKEKVEADIKSVVEYATSFSEFEKLMSDLGYKINHETNTFLYQDGETFIQCSDEKLDRSCRLDVLKMKFAEKQVEDTPYVNFKELSNLKFTIDKMIRYSESMEDFLKRMANKGYGYKVDDGVLKFHVKGMSGYIICEPNTVGTHYTFENIKRRIEDVGLNYKEIGKIIDGDLKDSKAFKSWATTNNITTIMNNLQQITKYNLHSFAEIEPCIENFEEKIQKNLKTIEASKAEIKILNTQIALSKKSADVEKFQELRLKKQKLNLRITDLYDQNRQIKYDVTLLKKIQKNASLFMDKDYSQDKSR